MPDYFDNIENGDWEAVRRLVVQLNTLNIVNKHVFVGRGAPTGTPSGRALYIRTDGGASTTLYVWEGASWVGK